jgi:hypothetical protein
VSYQLLKKFVISKLTLDGNRPERLICQRVRRKREDDEDDEDDDDTELHLLN